jgi:hypothetical protein
LLALAATQANTPGQQKDTACGQNVCEPGPAFSPSNFLQELRMLKKFERCRSFSFLCFFLVFAFERVLNKPWVASPVT